MLAAHRTLPHEIEASKKVLSAASNHDEDEPNFYEESRKNISGGARRKSALAAQWEAKFGGNS